MTSPSSTGHLLVLAQVDAGSSYWLLVGGGDLAAAHAETPGAVHLLRERVLSAPERAAVLCWASSGRIPPSPISRSPPSAVRSAASAASSSSNSADSTDTGIDFTSAPSAPVVHGARDGVVVGELEATRHTCITSATFRPVLRT
jgi:hypothetical protein